MAESRIWLGKPGHFRAECSKLIGLLREIGNRDLRLETQPRDNYQWILEANLDAPVIDGNGEITLFTSGTTGISKPVIKNWLETLEKKRGKSDPTAKWLLTYSPTRWAGLSVIAHCLTNQCEIVLPDDLSNEALGEGLTKCTHVSLTPSLFRRLLLSGQIAGGRAVKQVTFGGEYCTQATIDLARSCWPSARISHVYAAAEFGDVACASDGREGYPRLPGELSPEGELILEGRPTGDLWKYVGDRFYFQGRNIEVINVGGAKVNTFEVERAMREIDGVFEARVFGVPSPLLGQILCADYVGSLGERELTALLRSRLPKPSVPKLKKVEQINLSESGKIKRA